MVAKTCGRLDQRQRETKRARERGRVWKLSWKNFALPLKFKDESDSCCERNRKRWTRSMPREASFSSSARLGAEMEGEESTLVARIDLQSAWPVCLALCHTNHKNASSISGRCCLCCCCSCTYSRTYTWYFMGHSLRKRLIISSSEIRFSRQQYEKAVGGKMEQQRPKDRERERGRDRQREGERGLGNRVCWRSSLHLIYR